MSDITRVEYFQTLQRDLNPGIFETEWLSSRTWQVHMAALGSAEETIEQCLVVIDEILAARGQDKSQLEQIVSQAPVPPALKEAFREARQGPDLTPGDQSEALARLSIYCFAHIAYGVGANNSFKPKPLRGSA